MNSYPAPTSTPPQPELSPNQQYVQQVCHQDRQSADRHFTAAGMIFKVINGDKTDLRSSFQWLRSNTRVPTDTDINDDEQMQSRMNYYLDKGTKELARVKRKEGWAAKAHAVAAVLNTDNETKDQLTKQAGAFDFNIDDAVVKPNFADIMVGLEDDVIADSKKIIQLGQKIAEIDNALEHGTSLDEIDLRLAIKKGKFGQTDKITVLDLARTQSNILSEQKETITHTLSRKELFVASVAAIEPTDDISPTLITRRMNRDGYQELEPTIGEQSITCLQLNLRAYNCLKRGGVETLNDINNMNDDELLAIPNLGQKAVTEIREVFTEYIAFQV